MSDDSDDGAETKEPARNPFYRNWRAFKDAEYEMRFLKTFAPRDIEKICQSLPGFAELQEAYGFHLFSDVETTFQASFGNRSMFRKTLNGTTACENGPSLVYSQGPTGDIVVVLYPPSSELAKVNEKLIFLRMQERSAIKLMDGLKRDLKDLVPMRMLAASMATRAGCKTPAYGGCDLRGRRSATRTIRKSARITPSPISPLPYRRLW